MVENNTILGEGSDILSLKMNDANEYFAFNVHTDSAHNTLNIVLNKPFRSPLVGLYLAPTGTGSAADYQLLGQFSTVGNYQFILGNSIQDKKLVVYDQLKNEILAFINLK